MRSIQGMRPLLGVKQGGTQGRLGTFHMGLSGTWGGGMNTSGSGRAPIANSHGPVAAKPSGFRLPQMSQGFGVKPRPTKGQPGFDSGRLPMSAPRPSARPLPVAAKPVTPAAPTGPVVPPSDPLDYRSQAGYIRDMAMLGDDLAGQRRALQSQLEEGQRLYGVAMGDARRDYTRSVDAGEDSLNRAGLLRSGTREVSDADRIREFDRHMADIEQQHGTGLSARINAALAELERREAFDREGIEGAYRDEWSDLHPAAPIGMDEPVDTAPAGPVTKPVVGPKAPAKKPLHPNAQTYTSGGVLRQVGTGRPVLRPAPLVVHRPVSKPASLPPRNPFKK